MSSRGRLGDPGLVVDGRRPEEVRVGLRCGEAGEVAAELSEQVGAPAGVAAVQCDVRVARLVEMVVVQTMHDAIRAHGDAGRDRDTAAHKVVEPTGSVETIVRRIVGEHEAGVLLRRDHDHGGNDRPRRPPRQRDGGRCGDHSESGQYRECRSHGIEVGELAQCLGRKRSARARIVAKLLAVRDRFGHGPAVRRIVWREYAGKCSLPCSPAITACSEPACSPSPAMHWGLYLKVDNGRRNSYIDRERGARLWHSKHPANTTARGSV